MHLLLYALFLLICFPLFLSSVLSAASDSSECSPRYCGNLTEKLGYPFGTDGSNCGASPYFQLSNCTPGAHPLWPGFNATYTENQSGFPSPAPAVIGINSTPTGTYNHVNLSWIQQINSYTSNSGNSKCVALPLDKPSSYGFPSAIKFLYATASPDLFRDFQFSGNNIVLVFNCSNISAVSATNYLANDSSYCKKYNNFCNTNTSKYDQNSCYSYYARRELDLSNFKDNYSCTRFAFYIADNANTNVDEWEPYTVQLTWSSTDLPSTQSCNECENHNGSCGFSEDAGSNSYGFKCFCSPDSGDYCAQPSTRTDTLKSRLHIGMYIGIATVGIITLTLLSRIIYRRHKQGKRQDFHLPADALCDRPVEVPYKSISAFKDKVGEGGNGVVYRGIMKTQHLDNAGICTTVDLVVAVKVLDPDSKHSHTQFVREVSTIGSIHHLNVVKLLGFCSEKSHRVLIYEFVSNGSLEKWLFRNRDGVNDVSVLDWNLRYSIALGVARGLCYLHEECRHRIVHCDIKPQNILLDENMNPKISDFGLAKLITRRGDAESVMTMAKGTPGYVAPEFWMGGESRLTTKFDVYSYGMLLLELISGRPNFVGCETRSYFPVQAFEAIQNQDFQKLLDERVNANDLSMDDLEKLRSATIVALWCVQDSPNLRPSMKEVMQFLEGRLNIPERCPPPPAIVTSRSNVVEPFWNSNSSEEDSLTSSRF